MTSGTQQPEEVTDVLALDYGQCSGQSPTPAEVPIRQHIGKSPGQPDGSKQRATRTATKHQDADPRPRPKPTVEPRSLVDGAEVTTPSWWGPKKQKKRSDRIRKWDCLRLGEGGKLVGEKWENKVCTKV
ncbi:uncharacterized protein LOC119770219 [Culex quinquefasciatus]|uniref:uncharacterized protein LOC119770219 n=1 Tax=Culex quinquefasciatus TaxID=7176 RepID=UPI0018E2C8A3|nr:uncharacterized protein LOC119770219 [Culex quinquefasciatus]